MKIKLKKMFSLLLAGVLVISLLPATAFANDSNNNNSVGLSASKNDVNAGDSFTVNVVLHGTANVTAPAAAEICFNYDKDLISFGTVDVTTGIDNIKATADEGKAVVTYYGAEETFDLNGELVLATYSFTGFTTGNAKFTLESAVAAEKGSKPDITLDMSDSINVSISPMWKGEGDESSPYIISDTADLERLRNLVNAGNSFAGKYFKIADDVSETDITLSGYTIGYYYKVSTIHSTTIDNKPFSGIFDGNGKVVTTQNLIRPKGTYPKDTAGLFANIEDATIKNLTVAGDNCIIGRGANCLIENCTNMSNIETTGKAHRQGGILCYAEGDYVTIRDCVNRGTITNKGKGTSYGGIAGMLDAKKNTVTNCINYASIDGGGQVAGIVGESGSSYFNEGATIAETCVISDCMNYGDITANAGGSVSGIIGDCFINLTVEKCGNTGVLYARGGRGGGIIGRFKSVADFGNKYTCSTLKIDQCYNTGKLYVEDAEGGIAGIIQGFSNESCISNVYNTGTIEEKTYEKTDEGIGGIVGYIMSFDNDISLLIENAYNLGQLIPAEEDRVGQIVGGADIGLIGSDESRVSFKNVWYLIRQSTGSEGSETESFKAIGLTDSDKDGVTGHNESDLRSVMTKTVLGDKWTDDVGINDGYPILLWQDNIVACDVVTTITAPDEAKVVLTVNGKEQSGGESTVKVGKNSSINWSLVIAKEYEVVSWTINGQNAEYSCVTKAADTTYSNSAEVTEATNVNITIQKKTADTTKNDQLIESTVSRALVWDGVSVDVSWYFGHENDKSYKISTAAQLMGVSALVNGLVNENCKVYTTTTQYIDASEWNKNNQYVITAKSSDSGSTGQNMSTETYHYGIEDFNGKTVTLTKNVDMGGSYSYGSWFGPNFMPIGGQYLMKKDDSSTKLSSSFCGTFDGGGHYIYNIYCDRYCSTGNFGDGQSVGLIGRLGVHDADPESLRPVNPTVKNVGITGYIYANRSVGGIVGKTGKTAYNTEGSDGKGYSVIENCVNYATIVGTDAKGTGGICGAAYNGGIIKNCYNTGSITGGWPAGGIAGENENTLISCYNVGYVDSTAGSNYGEAIGTRNGSFNHAVVNCWYLEGSSSDSGYYNDSTVKVTAMNDKKMKVSSFVDALNLYEDAYLADTKDINGGYPVLKWQLKNSEGDNTKKDDSSSGGKDITDPPITDPDSKLPFDDIEDHWAKDSIVYIYNHKLINGISETKFAPDITLTRAMLVTVLYRLDGEPSVSGDVKFTDVSSDSWYSNAVLWGSQNDIIKGFGDGRFAPEASVTREQMSAIFMRYASYKGVKTDERADISNYTDRDNVSSWALDSVKWSVAKGLIKGRTETTIAPKGTTTRAEISAVLERYLKNVISV